MIAKLLRHRLVQNALVMYGVQITGYILPLLTLPYLTRTLGPANFGLLSLGLAFVQYFWVVTEYGFGITGTRSVAIVYEDIGRVSRIYSAVMACKMALIGLCFLALAAIVFATPKLRDQWPLYFVSFLMVLGWGVSPNWLFQGMQRMKFVAYSDYGAKIVSVGLIFLLVRKQSDYLLAAAIQSGGFVLSGIIGLAICFGAVKVRLVRPTWAEMREKMVEGWPVFLSTASLTVTSSSNTVILGMMATPDKVGFFSGASRLLISAKSLTNPVTTAIYPHMSQLAARSRGEAVDFLKRRVIWSIVPFLLFSMGLLVAAPLVSRLVYGPRFAESGVLLRIMAFTPFVHSVGVCFSTFYMLAFGYEKQWSKIVRWMTALNFGVLALMLLVLEPSRAVAATIAIVETCSAACYVWFYRRTVSTHTGQGAVVATEQP